jgi:hypothetical protein
MTHTKQFWEKRKLRKKLDFPDGFICSHCGKKTKIDPNCLVKPLVGAFAFMEASRIIHAAVDDSIKRTFKKKEVAKDG